MVTEVMKSGGPCPSGNVNIGANAIEGSRDPRGKLLSLPREVSLLLLVWPVGSIPTEQLAGLNIA